jgi:hypothetical protein
MGADEIVPVQFDLFLPLLLKTTPQQYCYRFIRNIM